MVAVAVLVIAGVGIWWSQHGSGDAHGPVPGQLTKEFPTAPTVAWRVTAEQFGVGAFTLGTPVGDGYFDFPAALADDGGIAVNIESGGDIAGFRNFIAGVNMATGQIWKTQVEAKCPARIVGHVIACSKPTDYRSQYAFVDVRTGSEVGTAVVPKGGDGIADFDGEAVYVTSGVDNAADETTAMRITKLDGDGRTVWSVDEPLNGSLSAGFSATTASGGLVGSTLGGSTAVVSAANGRLVSRSVGAGSRLADGSLLGRAAITGELPPAGGDSGYRIVHPDGSETRLDTNADGSRSADRDQPLLTTRSLAGTAYFGGRLYRPGSTSSNWNEAVDVQRIVVVTPRVTVGVTGTGGLRGLDTNTGRLLWTAADGIMNRTMTKYGDSIVSDGSRVITLAADGTLSAVDIATGTVEWTMPGPTPTPGATHGGDDDAQAFLYAAGDKFVVLTGNTITAFNATGGAAAEPGAAAPPRATATSAASPNGGYYTRCGSSPTFTPQRFRTTSGGLVVSMKVTATCAGGDVLGAANTSFSVHDGDGLIASGTFDFSRAPIGIAPASGPDGGTVIELLFPPGSFWRLPDTVGTGTPGTGSAGADSTTAVAANPGILVDCERPDGGAQQAPQSNGRYSTPRGGESPSPRRSSRDRTTRTSGAASRVSTRSTASRSWSAPQPDPPAPPGTGTSPEEGPGRPGNLPHPGEASGRRHPRRSAP